MARSPDFLAIGHVTKDLLPGGEYTIGGTATYAALTAQRLGLSVAVLTSAPPELDLSSALPHIALHVIPSEVATTFENIYEGQKRRQFVHGIASPLKAAHLPLIWRQSAIVLLCPLVNELGLDWMGTFPGAIVGVTPQGWMRQWDERGLVTTRVWTEAQQILPNVEVLVYSEEDVACDEVVIRHYAKMAKIAVVTRGWRGATVFYNGIACDFPAFRAKEVDPTGAGDVFAAAFLVRLRETGDPYQAAPFANCAASFSIEGLGTTTIPTRQQVEERLRFGKLYQ
ncbi:MAG: PfkB family carbohydrate kinase [Candidatus Hadarchaeum sp.]